MRRLFAHLRNNSFFKGFWAIAVCVVLIVENAPLKPLHQLFAVGRKCCLHSIYDCLEIQPQVIAVRVMLVLGHIVFNFNTITGCNPL